MKQYINILNTYIFAWCILNAGVITNPSVSVLCLGFLFLVSFFYMFKVFLESKNIVISILLIFVLLLSIYGIQFIMSGERLYIAAGEGRFITNREYLMLIYQSILPIFPFYYFARHNKLTVALMQKWILVFFVVVIMSYIKNQYLIISSFGMSEDGLTNNAGYEFLALFPLISLCNKNRLIQNILFIVCLIFIIFSVKRGAIIVGIIAYPWFLLNSSGKSGKSRFKTLLLVGLASVVIYNLFTYLIATNDYFLMRYEETLDGNTSGRDTIYQSLIHTYTHESTFIQQLFGRGAYGTLKVADNVAHNDWLELLIDLGLFGFIVYFVYWISLIKTWISLKVNKEIYLALGLFVIIYLSKTFFSMSYSDMPIYSTIVFGYCLAHSQQKKLSTNNMNN